MEDYKCHKIKPFVIIYTMDNKETQKDIESNATDQGLENLKLNQLADKAVEKALRQLIVSTEFKAPRLAKVAKYYALYNGQTVKKLRQLFNVPIPVFPGMIDTLNAQHDSPIQVKLQEGGAEDYFKVKKIDAAFRMETMDSNESKKWDNKLRQSRKDAIFTGRGITRYEVTSDPKYKSNLKNVSLKDFHFQPKGGSALENHLWAGQEGFKRTKHDLLKGVKSGKYDKAQVDKLITTASESHYEPQDSQIIDINVKLERFKPLGLNPDNDTYVGEQVFMLCEWVLNMNGERYYILFEPWTRVWISFKKWKDMNSSGLYPWDSWATHEDNENFLSKSYADDLYTACDAIVALFNQELSNREKRNFTPRAYDKDMFTDVRKLDQASYRPDALVPVDTKGGSRRISEGLYEFKVGELVGTVNLIDWISGSLGRNTGANDLSMGAVQDANKAASVTFAEQRATSKRLSWASASFQDMMASLTNKFIWGLKDHMPSEMAIKLLGQNGWDWEQITRLELDTEKDIDIIILSTDKQLLENESKSKKRQEILGAIGADPNLSIIANSQWRLEQMLRTGEWDDVEIATAMDPKTYSDKKSLAQAAKAIQLILQGVTPEQWFGATIAFMQKIVDFAADNRTTLKDKYQILLEFAMSHVEIVKGNLERKVQEESLTQMNMPQDPAADPNQQPESKAENPGMPGGMSRAMQIGNAAIT